MRRLGQRLESGGGDVGAVDVDLAVGEAGAQELQRLLETVEANAGAIPRHTHRLVLALQPSGAEAELEAAFGEEVEGGDFLCEHDGLAVVDAEDAGTDVDRARRLDRYGHRGDRREVLHRMVRGRQCGAGADHMVGDRERAEPGGLGAAGLLAPVLRGVGCIALQPEAERTYHQRTAFVASTSESQVPWFSMFEPPKSAP